MTRKQHLEAAERFGHVVGAMITAPDPWGEKARMEGIDRNAILAGHHANAAMACPLCFGLGHEIGRAPELCPECDGRGWLRAEYIR